MSAPQKSFTHSLPLTTAVQMGWPVGGSSHAPGLSGGKRMPPGRSGRALWGEGRQRLGWESPRCRRLLARHAGKAVSELGPLGREHPRPAADGNGGHAAEQRGPGAASSDSRPSAPSSKFHGCWGLGLWVPCRPGVGRWGGGAGGGWVGRGHRRRRGAHSHQGLTRPRGTVVKGQRSCFRGAGAPWGWHTLAGGPRPQGPEKGALGASGPVGLGLRPL